MDNFAPFAPLILSVLAISVAIYSWHKNRVIYGILTVNDRDGDKKVNELLNTGQYTILHVKQDAKNPLRTMYVLGKVKK